MDEIVRKIYEEDQREIERKMLSQKATKEYIQEFNQQREIWKQQEKDIMEAENRKIQEYAKEQQQRDDALKANKRAKVGVWCIDIFCGDFKMFLNLSVVVIIWLFKL